MTTDRYEFCLIDGFSKQFYIFKAMPGGNFYKGSELWMVEKIDYDKGGNVPMNELVGQYAGHWWRKEKLMKTW